MHQFNIDLLLLFLCIIIFLAGTFTCLLSSPILLFLQFCVSNCQWGVFIWKCLDFFFTWKGIFSRYGTIGLCSSLHSSSCCLAAFMARVYYVKNLTCDDFPSVTPSKSLFFFGQFGYNVTQVYLCL